MSNAETKVFEIEDLRRKIFDYVYQLPSCKYCYHKICNSSSIFGDPVCDECIIYFYDYRILHDDNW